MVSYCYQSLSVVVRRASVLLCVVRQFLASEHSRGHSFSPIIIILAQNDHLDNISIKFEYGSCGVKNKVSRSNHGQTLVNTLEATVLVQSSSDLLRMIILTISHSVANLGDVGSKTRSVGQIMEKPCEHSRGHSFGPIFIKLAQNDHLDNISFSCEFGWRWVKN